MQYLFADHRVKNIPYGVELVALTRTIRWIGWGFGEALLPIFFLQFSSSITEAGILQSVVQVVFLIIFPLVGLLADTFSSKALLVAAALLYPFVGLSFYLAGVTSLVLFVVLARIINGFGYTLDIIGTDAYLRRCGDSAAPAATFGFVDTLSNFGWLLAVVASFFLVSYVPVYVLLAMLVPMSLLSLVPLWRLKSVRPPHRELVGPLRHPYRSILSEIAGWHTELRRLAFVAFLVQFIYVLATFFLPIAAYEGGASLQQIVFMTVVFSLPYVFSLWCARFVDRSDRRRVFAFAMLTVPAFCLLIAVYPAYFVEVIAAFFLECAVIFLNLVLQSYITTAAPREHYGRVSSVMEAVGTLGSMIAPVAIGLIIDTVGFASLFMLCAVTLGLITLYFRMHPLEIRDAASQVA